MRVLCILLFCLSTAAALRLQFPKGKRYSYKYEGTIAQGVTEALEKDLALKIGAKVHFDFLRNGFVRMTLEDVTLAKIVDKVLYNDRIETKNVKGKTEDLEDVRDKLKECLEKPVKFSFKNVEKRITTEANVREWCVNIQRAIINHYYLPIKRQGVYQIRFAEVTILGKCNVVYNIIVNKALCKVKRVINLARCKERPNVLELSQPNTDAFYQKRVGRATARRLPNFIRTAAYMDYDLDCGAKEGAIIRRVVSENVEELTINGDLYKAGKAIAAHAKQTLTLLAKELPIPDNPKTIKKEFIRGGLLFVFDKDKTDLLSPQAQGKFLEKAKEQIDALKEQLQSGNIKAETAMRITRLVTVLRRCTAETLRKVVKDIVAETNRDVKRLALDALARVGTEPAGAVLKECITGGRFTRHLKRIMLGVGWVRGLDYRFIKHVLDICEHEVVVADVKAHAAGWLSLGTLYNRLILKLIRYPRMTQDTNVLALLRTVQKTVKEALAKKKLEKDYNGMLVYLKAIGNAGWIDRFVFKTIYDLIYDVATPLHVKVQGIWSLRHMARFRPIWVRHILMPLIANPLVDPEIRASCYKIIIQNDPSLVTCQMLASVLAREAAGKGPRSNQFVSFVASDLRTSVNYDNIDLVKASRARLLLRIVPRAVAFSILSYSKAINVPFDAGRGMGFELRVNKINGPQTFIPRHLHTKLKVNMPGISANFFELGLRMQGLHDTFMPHIGPKCKTKQHTLDILSYIFGTEKPDKNEAKRAFQNNLRPLLSTYIKLYGSEVYFGRLVEEDLLEIVRDALFGDKKVKKGGCTFATDDINCELPFTRAHLLSEKRYMIPTLIGIPFKYSGKVAVALKGEMAAHLTGLPKLMTFKFTELQARMKVKPTVSFHMHHKVCAWLPVFESGIIVKHELFSQPKVRFVFTVTKKGFNMAAPIVEADQKLVMLKPELVAVMRKELTAGDRKWMDIDLQLTQRGFIDVPETCYGQTRFNLMICRKGRIVDAEYLRLKRLTTFPFYWLDQLDVRVKNDEADTPTKFEASYEITSNTDTKYTGTGKVAIMGKTKDITAVMDVTCDKTTFICHTKWTFQHKKCPETCTADTTMNYADTNKFAVYTKYGTKPYELNHDILCQDEGKTLKIITTWNELGAKWLDYFRLNRPWMMTFLYRYFGIKENDGTAGRSEIKVKLINKFLADIFVKTPTMKLRRINQELPIAVKKFYFQKRNAMIDKFYAKCMVRGTNYIETTDEVVIQAELPGTCPFVLAEDRRGEQAKWRIMLRQAEGGRQNLIIKIGDVVIELRQDKTVLINGVRTVITTGKRDIAGGTIMLVGNEIRLKSNCGFEVRFDGSLTRVFFSPWYHNRIRGICGNNDAEQWTDFATRRKTCMPETMTREFLRDWVVPGTTCKDPYCKMVARHIELPKTAINNNKVCFSIGRFLRCIKGCQVAKKHIVQKVAHHCLKPNDPLVARLRIGDPTVALETKSVDLYGPVKEHVACQCNCE